MSSSRPVAVSRYPAVSTTATGTFSVQGVPVGSGTGTVALSVYPDDCSAPAPTPYSGLTAGNVATANVTISCIPPPAPSPAASSTVPAATSPARQSP